MLKQKRVINSLIINEKIKNEIEIGKLLISISENNLKEMSINNEKLGSRDQNNCNISQK